MKFLMIISLFISYTQAQVIDVAVNGTFKNLIITDSKAVSENGKFWYTYDIGTVTDETREILNFRLYKENDLIYSMYRVPGSDVEISNSGVIAVYDHSEHFKNKITIHFYSSDGDYYKSLSFTGAGLFKFSTDGNRFGVRTSENISVISFPENIVDTYPKGYEFDFSENNNFISIVSENRLLVFKGKQLLYDIQTEISLPRKVALSEEHNLLVLIDKFNLAAYSLSSGELLWKDILDSKTSFRDLKIIEDKIYAGLHTRENNISSGHLKIYETSGNVLEIQKKSSKGFKSFQPQQKRIEKTRHGYDPIPWMFEPFDSMRTVWNHYEQHMGGGSNWSYLHQGLDLITPIGEPTYSVSEGVVKLVLTIGGAVYWRIAIADSQVPGISNGWLYAHLIENTIQFDIGDTVNIHDYLGDIVAWTSEWGHIHFVEIQDSGTIWFFEDDEWGITFNPMLALDPLPDFTPPIIENAFENSKFAFCLNETSIYLDPDSLYGEIDIIVKVVDYAGDSEWQQPAFETYYWIRDLETDSTVVPRKLGHILNHAYSMYNSDHYFPYATVLYKRDEIFPAPFWMETERGFYHVLTNSDGDAFIDTSEKYLALNTADFADGPYRIYIEVFDEAGNSEFDSMDVIFDNHPNSVSENKGELTTFALFQNYPNPFNPSTKIKYSIPDVISTGGRNLIVTLKVFDVLGREISTLINEEKQPGVYEVEFDASNLAGGIYFYSLNAGNFNQTKKLMLLK